MEGFNWSIYIIIEKEFFFPGKVSHASSNCIGICFIIVPHVMVNRRWWGIFTLILLLFGGLMMILGQKRA